MRKETQLVPSQQSWQVPDKSMEQCTKPASLTFRSKETFYLVKGASFCGNAWVFKCLVIDRASRHLRVNFIDIEKQLFLHQHSKS